MTVAQGAKMSQLLAAAESRCPAPASRQSNVACGVASGAQMLPIRHGLMLDEPRVWGSTRKTHFVSSPLTSLPGFLVRWG